MKTHEGPSMSHLHHRMTAAPSELMQPKDANHLPALVHDLLYRYQQKFSAELLIPFRETLVKCPWYSQTFLLLHFYADTAFTKLPISIDQLVFSLQEKAKELYAAGKNSLYVEDLDRREEFIRVALSAVNLRPEGETDTQAEDRLISVSSTERKRVLEAAKAAEERAAKIREALALKAAQEAANKMSRE